MRTAQHVARLVLVAILAATVALVATLFPLNTHLAFYSAWWGLLFAWLLGLWCAALYVFPSKQGEAA